MTEKVFTPQQVKNLNLYQAAGVFHPFTCGNNHEGDNTLIAKEEGWVCPNCDYTQNWAHGLMLDFTPERLKEMSPFADAILERLDKESAHD